jgi:hypothetical protein
MTNSSSGIAEKLKNFFETQRDPILFAGAGTSMLAGLPDWKSLLTQMAEAIRSADPLTANHMLQSIARGRLTKAADYFWLSDDVLEGDKHKTLKALLANYASAPLHPLTSLPFRAILTTNFDRVIHDAIVSSRHQSPRDYKLGDASFSQAIWETEFYVARIHGCVEAPASIVLSEAQFADLLDNEAYIDLLTNTFTHKSVLFLGFSFYDPAIRHVFEQIEKRFGPAVPGRHLALVPSSNTNELIQKASRLNIEVFQYEAERDHKPLWDGISAYARSIPKEPPREVTASDHPYSATKKYLAACYARASVASEPTPLREIVIEGILSAALQDAHPKSLGRADLCERARKAIGVKGPELDNLVDSAARELVSSKLVRRHREEGSRGPRFVWTAAPEETSTLDTAIETLKTSICDRAYVQEGWRPPQHVADIISLFLREMIHRRGWDLGAAFASGKAPDTVSFSSALAEIAYRIPTHDRVRIERIVSTLFQRPTEEEARLLGELGRIAFALELAFQAPRTTILHKATLPRRIYLDANILLPAFVEGHPHHHTYNEILRRLRTASASSGNQLSLVAYEGYLNEMISHRNAALSYAKEAGDDLDEIAKSDALYHGPANVNVYIGAYANSIENGRPPGFERFLRSIAPYTTERELRVWIEKRGFSIAQPIKSQAYASIYAVLERSNATKIANGKLPILIEHDALQLSLLEKDRGNGERALFVTADRQLFEDIQATPYAPLGEFMISHVGIVQFVDLLVGLRGDDRAVGELLWSNKVSERSQRIRSYLTVEALSKYDAALAMNMHTVVEAQSEEIARRLERDGMDLEAESPKARIRALRSLGSLEAGFFAGMSDAIVKASKNG